MRVQLANINTLMLQVCMIRAAYHRPRGDSTKAELISNTGILAKLIWMNITLHRSGMFTWLQILPHGEHVDIMGAQILEHTNHLLKGFSQAHHNAGFSGDLWMLRFKGFEQL